MALPLHVDKDSSTPLWIQLRMQIVNMIRHGELEPEQKMPTCVGWPSSWT